MIGATGDARSDLTGAKSAGRWYDGFEEGLSEYFLDPNIHRKSRNPAPADAEGRRPDHMEFKKSIRRERGEALSNNPNKSIVDIVNEHRAKKAQGDPGAIAYDHGHAEPAPLVDAPEVVYQSRPVQAPQPLRPQYQPPQQAYQHLQPQPVQQQVSHNIESDEALLTQLVSVMSAFVPPEAYSANPIIAKVMRRLGMSL